MSIACAGRLVVASPRVDSRGPASLTNRNVAPFEKFYVLTSLVCADRKLGTSKTDNGSRKPPGANSAGLDDAARHFVPHARVLLARRLLEPRCHGPSQLCTAGSSRRPHAGVRHNLTYECLLHCHGCRETYDGRECVGLHLR